MAIITKRRKAFTVVHQVIDENGHNKQVHETFYDYNQALKRKKQIENDSDMINIDSESTIVDFFYQYTSIVGIKEWSITRYESTMGIINNYLEPVLNSMKIKDINDDFASWIIKEMSKTKAIGKRHQRATLYMPASMQYAAYLFLKKSFDYLISQKLIETNGFHDCIVIKPSSNKRKQEWNISILDQILKQCERVSLFLFIHLVFATGFDIKEVLALNWDNISNEQDNFYIQSNTLIERMNINSSDRIQKKRIIENYGSHGFNNTNTTTILYLKEKGVKTAKIHPKLYNLLMLWKEKQSKGISEHENQHRLIFTYFDGRPIDSRTMSKYYDQIIKQMNTSKLSIATLKNFGVSKRKNGIGTIADLYYDCYQTDNLPERKQNGEIQKKEIESLTVQSERIKNYLPKQSSVDVSILIHELNSNPELKAALIKKLEAEQQ